MKIVAKTDKGVVREQNQDAYYAGEVSQTSAWAVVCDGMGGAAAGNIASSVAAKMISEKITSGYIPSMSDNSIRNILISGVETANICIYEMAEANTDLRGMGTTVVAALVSNKQIYIAHAGDSRAYKISNGKMVQLTKDHSIVQVMLENGELTPDEAREHPRKNIITRALGVDEQIDVDFCQESFEENEVIIICSDGLTNYVETADIYEATKDGRFHEFADRLVALANENGGGDNITVVAIAY